MDVFFLFQHELTPHTAACSVSCDSDLSSVKIRFADKHLTYDIRVSLGSGFINAQMTSQQYDGAHSELTAAGVNLRIL